MRSQGINKEPTHFSFMAAMLNDPGNKWAIQVCTHAWRLYRDGYKFILYPTN